ncbi:MAG: tail fiber domain-containing protein [Bacteroidota bacterium]
MKFSFLMMVGALCAFLTLPAWGQTGVGTPSNTIQFSTNGSTAGGVAPLGHGQQNIFGDITGKSTWTAIGQAPFSPPGVAAPYGIRVQRRNAFGLFNLVDGLSFGTTVLGQDLLIGFGESDANTLRIRYISDQFTNTFKDLMIARRSGISFSERTSVGREANSTTSTLTEAFFGQTSRTVAGNSFNVNAGVRGLAFNFTGTATDYGGYFSTISTAPNKAAAFFSGDIVVTGTVHGSSDRRLKKSIKEAKGSLDQVMQLNTYTYEYRTDEYDYMNLPTGTHTGLIAQEVEEIMPELVKEAYHPHEFIDENGELQTKKGMTFKSVNYMSLVPLMIGALQEFKAETETKLAQAEQAIAAKDARIADLEAAVAALQGNSVEAPANSSWPSFGDAELFQNTPNPFTEQTTIRYNLPQNFERAALYVYDMNGRQVNSFNNLSRKGSLTIEGSTLDAGMYIYSLIVDGQEIATKRMILTK